MTFLKYTDGKRYNHSGIVNVTETTKLTDGLFLRFINIPIRSPGVEYGRRGSLHAPCQRSVLIQLFREGLEGLF